MEMDCFLHCKDPTGAMSRFKEVLLGSISNTPHNRCFQKNSQKTKVHMATSLARTAADFRVYSRSYPRYEEVKLELGRAAYQR